MIPERSANIPCTFPEFSLNDPQMSRLNVPRLFPVPRRGSGGRSGRRSGCGRWSGRCSCWRRGVAAPDRAPDFSFHFNLFIFISYNIFHQVLLHNIDSRHWKGHQIFGSIYFILIYFNCFSGAALLSRGTIQGTRLFFIIFICLSIVHDFDCASGAAPQHGVVAPDMTPD